MKESTELLIVFCCTVFCFMLVALIYWNVHERYRTPLKASHSQCLGCHDTQQRLSNYFEKAGSKQPKEMAHAVLKTGKPRLLAAVSVVETGGNPTAARTGYKKRHFGAFQVNPRHWGKVPKDAVGQALQAEKILSELTQEMPLKKALSLYGGDSTDKYQKRILAELTRVP